MEAWCGALWSVWDPPPDDGSARAGDLSLCFLDTALLLPLQAVAAAACAWNLATYARWRVASARPPRRWTPRAAVALAAAVLAAAAALANAVWWAVDAVGPPEAVAEAWVAAIALVLAAARHGVSARDPRERYGPTELLLFWAAWVLLGALRTRTLVLASAAAAPVALFTASWALGVPAVVAEAWPRPRPPAAAASEAVTKAATMTTTTVLAINAPTPALEGGADATAPLLAGRPRAPSVAAAVRPSPLDYANIYSRLTFSWLGGLIAHGKRQGVIRLPDVPSLPTSLRTERSVRRVTEAWRAEVARVDAQAAAAAAPASAGPVRERPSLWRAAWAAGWRPFARAAPLRLAQETLAFMQPLLLEQLMAVIEAGDAAPSAPPPARGYLIAVGMFATAVAQALLAQQVLEACFAASVAVRGGIIGLLFAKALRQSNAARLRRTVGETVNFMAIDAQRMSEMANRGHDLWVSPLQVVVALALLAQQLGLAVFAGVGVLLLFTPLDAVLARRIKAGQKVHMKRKDARMRLIDELLLGIKMVKLYAWEDVLRVRLDAARGTELQTLRAQFVRLTLQAALWASGPVLVSVLSLGAFVLMYDEPLTPTRAFVSLSLFALLQTPLTALPTAVAAALDASVAAKRLTKYLDSEEHELAPPSWDLPAAGSAGASDNDADDEEGEEEEDDHDAGARGAAAATAYGALDSGEPLLRASASGAYLRADDAARGGGAVGRVAIHAGTFYWQPPARPASGGPPRYLAPPALDDVSLELPRGGLTAVVGGVGSGKTALLAAFLGEIHRASGVVTVVGRVAYAAQQPWILNASVRDNILFGAPYDPMRYWEVVRACALEPDLAVLAAGDRTEIGERGINLSGGQRQRISLARAVYAQADVYLLDDPLSAVDAHVSRHLFERVIGPQGLLAHTTRVLITHELALLPAADWIVLLAAGGRVAAQGTWAALQARAATEQAAAAAAAPAAPTSQPQPPPQPQQQLDSVAALVAAYEARLPLAAAAASEVPPAAPTVPPQQRGAVLLDAGHAKPPPSPTLDDEDDGAGALTHAERVGQGAVTSDVYRHYARVAGVPATVSLLALLAAAQAAQVGGSMWVQYWTTQPEDEADDRLALYLSVYAALGLLQVALVAGGTAVGSIVVGLGAARRLYNGLLDNVLRGTLAFFDTTPTGRTLNRFSKDVDSVDLNLPRAITALLRTLFTVLGILVAIAVATPAFALAILPLFAAVVLLQRYFLVAKRDLKRLDSVLRGPVIAHFAEVLQGVATIRAYGHQARFAASHLARLVDSQRAFYYSITSNRWLAVRLELLGAIVVLLAALLAVGLVGSVDAALAGLSVSYALQITGVLTVLSRTWVETETHIIAVERILEYNHVPHEAPAILPDRRAPLGWPSRGALAFADYATRYRPELDLVLRDVTFALRPAEKLGVVGRTGSGKSSLLLAATRLLEPVAGRIEIDALNVGPGQLGLKDLRSRLAVVPQDPLLFSGTIRSNLDPWSARTEEELWWALERVALDGTVRALPHRLDHAVVQGGANLSAGERQLLCLARALLLRTRLLLLDEATSSVDLATDALVQSKVREAFADATVVIIAHRLDTVRACDRVLVLDHGRVVECDAPDVLLGRPDSAFAALVRQSAEAM